MFKNKLIIAVDKINIDVILTIYKFSPKDIKIKVGSILYTKFGPDILKVFKDYDVFLDLKYHDIPNTVALSTEAACELGIWMLTLHAAGGQEMMQAAKASRDACARRLSSYTKLIAVTILTSQQENNTSEKVVQLAQDAMAAGLDGVVCSPWEAAAVRKVVAPDFIIVTPGIRSAEDKQHDQVRVMSPAEAIEAGSDYLVMGRSIMDAEYPVIKIEQLLRSNETHEEYDAV